jgi:D-sedoheptulose 7-phosphate isomerase
MSDPQSGFLRDYFGLLEKACALTEPLAAQLFRLRDDVVATGSRGGTVRIVANGGSLAIASHIAADMTKNVGVPCTTYADASFVSCLTNDYGHEAAYAHALRLTAGPADLIILISSSGRSPNIVKAAAQATQMGLPTVALTGMDVHNPVGVACDYGLWVDSNAYNVIETTHQFWLMSVIDMLIGDPEYKATRIVGRR